LKETDLVNTIKKYFNIKLTYVFIVH